MTSKARIEAALEGRATDTLPFCPFLAYVWESWPQAVRERGQLAFHQQIGADPLWRGAPCVARGEVDPQVRTRSFDENGRRVTVTETPVGSVRMAHAASVTGNTTFLVEHPLKTEEDYKIWMWVEEHTRIVRDSVAAERHLSGDGREGLSLGMLVPRCKSAFQVMVETLVGTEELAYALADFPETVRALWQVMVQRNLEAVRLASDSPYDIFITWEDSSTQNYSPEQYDAYIGKEIGQWCDLLAADGKRYIQHACGHVAGLVERMRDHGVSAVESLSAPPTGNITVREARHRLGGGTGIVGGIEPVSFLNLQGAAFDRYVEAVIEEGRGGPFVLANSDSCPPGVTVEKYRRVAEIARSVKG